MELQSSGAGVGDCKKYAMMLGDVSICHEDIVSTMTALMLSISCLVVDVELVEEAFVWTPSFGPSVKQEG